MKKQKNRYAKSSKLSEAKFRLLVKFFAADLTAVQIAQVSGLNRNTVNRYLRLIRERLLQYCDAQRPFFGIVEVDESLFGAKRVKGKRGRGAYGKTTVFGIYERAGQVYTEVVPNCSKATLQGIIRGRVDANSVINSDGWRGYNGLVDIGYGHFRVNHSKDEFGRCLRIVKANSRTPGVSGRDRRRRLPEAFAKDTLGGRRSARLAMPKASRRRTRLAENHGKPSL